MGRPCYDAPCPCPSHSRRLLPLKVCIVFAVMSDATIVPEFQNLLGLLTNLVPFSTFAAGRSGRQSKESLAMHCTVITGEKVKVKNMYCYSTGSTVFRTGTNLNQVALSLSVCIETCVSACYCD